MPFLAIPVVIFGVTTAVGTIISVVITVASIAMGVLSYVAAQKAAEKAKAAQEAIYAAGQRVSVQFSGTQPRNYVYGHVRIGGLAAVINTTGTTGSHYNVLQVLTAHPITSYGNIYINSNVAQYPNGTIGSNYVSQSHAYFKANVADGTQTGPSAAVIQQFGGDITSAHKFTSCSYLASTYISDRYNNVFPSGPPQATIEVDGKKVYDPRNGLTRYSENPSLCILDYLRTILEVPDTFIDFDGFMEAANDCDGTVPLKTNFTRSCFLNNTSRNIDVQQGVGALNGLYVGLPLYGTGIPDGSKILYINNNPGEVEYFSIASEPTVYDTNATVYFGGSVAPEPLYTLNGMITSDQKPSDVLQNLLTTCRGRLVFDGGKYCLKVAKWRQPTITLDEGDILKPFTVQTKASSKDMFTGVRGTFIDPNLFFAATSYPTVTSSVFLAIDNGREAYADFALPFTDSPSMCQRLAKQELYNNRLSMVTVLTVNTKAVVLQPTDNVYIKFDQLGWTAPGKIFEVLKNKVDYSKATCELTLKETAEDIFDWTATEEQLMAQQNITQLNNPWFVPAPSNVTVSAGSVDLVKMPDGTILPGATVRWNSDDERVSSVEVQYKRSADNAWLQGGSVDNASAQEHSHIITQTQGENYDFAVRSKSFLGRYSNWVYVTALVGGKSVAPLTPSNITAAGGSGSALIRWSNNPDVDVDYDHTNIWVNSSNTFAGAVSLGSVSATTYTFAGIPGLHYFFLSNVDTSGNESIVSNGIEIIVSDTSGSPGPSGSIGEPGPSGSAGFGYNVFATVEAFVAKVDEKAQLLPSYTISGSLTSTISVQHGEDTLIPAPNYTSVGPGEFFVELFSETNIIVGKENDNTITVLSASDTKGEIVLKIYLESSYRYCFKTISYNGIYAPLPPNDAQYFVEGSGVLSGSMSQTYTVKQQVGAFINDVVTGSIQLHRNGIPVGFSKTETTASMGSDAVVYQAKEILTNKTYDTVYVRNVDTATATPSYGATLKIGATELPWHRIKGVYDSAFNGSWGLVDNNTATASFSFYSASVSQSISYPVLFDQQTSRFAADTKKAVSSSNFDLTASIDGTDTNKLVFHFTASDGTKLEKSIYASKALNSDVVTVMAGMVIPSGSVLDAVNTANTNGLTSSSFSLEPIKQRYNDGHWNDYGNVRLGAQWFVNSAQNAVGYGYVDYAFNTSSGVFSVNASHYPSESKNVAYSNNSPSVMSVFSWYGASTTLSAIAVDSGSVGASGSTGIPGSYYKNIYTRGMNKPATPVGDSPAGWYDYIPNGASSVYASTGRFGSDNHIIGAWSTPNRWSGATATYGDTFPDPATSDLVINDLFTNTSDFNTPYRWNGTSWVDARHLINWSDIAPGEILIKSAAVIGTAVINNAALEVASIGRLNLMSGSVGSIAIDVEAVNDSHIKNLSAGKITAGIITAEVALEASKVSSVTEVYHTGYINNTAPVIAFVGAELVTGSNYISPANAPAHPTWAYFSQPSLIMHAWNAGPSGYLPNRVCNDQQRFMMYVTGNGFGNNANNNAVMIYGPAYRISTNGGTTWGNWISPGHDNYCSIDYSSVVRTDPVNISLNGNETVQFGARISTGANRDVNSCGISAYYIMVEAANL